MSEQNPFLKPENYFEGYQEKIDELKFRPDVVDFDKLVYSVYSTEDGKKLMNEYKERFLFPGFVNPGMPHPEMAALYYEAFKEAFRLILRSFTAHQQRIDAENQKV